MRSENIQYFVHRPREGIKLNLNISNYIYVHVKHKRQDLPTLR